MADIRLAKPVAGTTQTVPSAPDGRFIFDFPADAATLTRNGDDLVLSFEDGSSIRLQGFYTTYSKEDMPSFQVEGVEISGQDFFAALGEDLMPAAGPAAGSSASRGGRYNEYGGSDLLDGIDHLGRLDIGFGDGVEWADDQVGGWTHQNLDPEISGIIAVDGNDMTLVESGVETDEGQEIQGNVFTPGVPVVVGQVMASDPDGGRLSYSFADGSNRIVTEYGVITIDADTGVITYTLNNDDPDADSLALGETVRQDFTVRVEDGQGGKAEASFSVTIKGTNDQPEVTLDADSELKLTESGVGRTEDGQVVTAPGTEDENQAYDGSHADGTGTQQLEGKVTGADVDAGHKLWFGVAAGDKSQDGSWEGAEAPAAGDFLEQDSTVEGEDSKSVVGTFGTLTLGSDGTWVYTLKGEQEDLPEGVEIALDGKIVGIGSIDELPEGAEVTDTFTIYVKDEHGAWNLETVTITITGTNDRPKLEVGDPDKTLYESGVGRDPATGVPVGDPGHENDPYDNATAGTHTTTGTITASDVDLGNTLHFAVSKKGEATEVPQDKLTDTDRSVTAQGSYGKLVVQETGNGEATYTYTLNENSDDIPLSVPVTINGTTYDDLEALKDALQFDGDRLTLNNLPEGATVTDSFTIFVQDDKGAWVSKDVTITITGTNDQPTVELDREHSQLHLFESGVGRYENGDIVRNPGGPDENNAYNGSTELTGKVTGADVDAGYELRFGVAAGDKSKDGSWEGADAPGEDDFLEQDSTTGGGGSKSVVGTFGTLTLSSDGTWVYTLKGEQEDLPEGVEIALDGKIVGIGSIDELPEGAEVTDTFTIYVKDEHGAWNLETVTITITGTNDRPKLEVGDPDKTLYESGVGRDPATGVPVGDPGHENDPYDNATAGTHTTTGTITASDVDLGNTLHFAVSKKGEATEVPQDSLTDGKNTAVMADGQFGTLKVTEGEDGEATYTYTLNEDAAEISFPVTISGITYASLEDLKEELGWDLDGDRLTLNNLPESATVTDSFTIFVQDDKGAWVSKDVTITIKGTNDQPELEVLDDKTFFDASGNEVSAADGHLHAYGTADTAADAVVKLTGRVQASDVDLENGGGKETTSGDNHGLEFSLQEKGYDSTLTSSSVWTYDGKEQMGTVDVTQNGDGWTATTDYGTLTLDENGNYTYTLHDGDPDVTALGEGETVTETFVVRAVDDRGAWSEKTITITIEGTDDKPVLSDDTESALDVYETGVWGDQSGAHRPDDNFTGGPTGSQTVTVSFEKQDANDRHSLVIAGSGLPANASLTVTDGGTSVEGAIYSIVAGANGTYTLTAIIPGVNEGKSIMLGTLRLEQNGTDSDLTYTFVPTQSGLNGLPQDMDLSIDIPLKVKDQNGNLSEGEHTATINIHGTNDRPTIKVTGRAPEDVYADGVGREENGIAVATPDKTELNPEENAPYESRPVEGQLTASDVDAGDTTFSYFVDKVGGISDPALTATVGDGRTTVTLSLNGVDVAKLTLDPATGKYSLTLLEKDEARAALAPYGEDVKFDFTVYFNVRDEHGSTAQTSASQKFSIHGTNDAPEIKDASDLGLDEGMVSVAGQVSAEDADAGHKLTYGLLSDPDFGSLNGADPESVDMTTSLSNEFGTLKIDPATGEYTFYLDPESEAVISLPEGEKKDLTFHVAVRDDKGAWSVEEITITITGKDTATVFVGDAAVVSVVEAGIVPDKHPQNDNDFTGGVPSAHGKLEAKDYDTVDGRPNEVEFSINKAESGPEPELSDFGALNPEIQAAISQQFPEEAWGADADIQIMQGQYGTLYLNTSTGQYFYQLDNDSDATNALKRGEIRYDDFSIHAQGTGKGDAQGADQPLKVAVRGSNDAPEVTGVTVDEGQTGLDVSDDGFTVTGIVEDGGTKTVTGQIGATDVDSPDGSAADEGSVLKYLIKITGEDGVRYVGAQSGEYGYLKLNEKTGEYTFVFNNKAAQHLGAGDIGEASFTVVVLDEYNAISEEKELTFEITGKDDVPRISGSTESITEDATDSVNIQPVTITDPDTGDEQQITSIVSPGGESVDLTGNDPWKIEGGYGTLTVTRNEDGSLAYTYQLTEEGRNELQSLNEDGAHTSVKENFTVMGNSGGQSVTGGITVTINGVNDAPTLELRAPDGQAVSAEHPVEVKDWNPVKGMAAGDDVDDEKGDLRYSVDDADPATAAQDGLQTIKGDFGYLTINSVTGEYTYVVDPFSEAYRELQTGTQDKEHFTITVTDPYGATDTKKIVFDVTKVEGGIGPGSIELDEPESMPEVTEDNGRYDVTLPPHVESKFTALETTDGGDVTVPADQIWLADADGNKSHVIETDLGSLILEKGKNGEWGYRFVLNNSSKAVQELNEDAPVTLNFKVGIGEHKGFPITVTIKGINDQPVIESIKNLEVKDTGGVAEGWIRTSDPDKEDVGNTEATEGGTQPLTYRVDETEGVSLTNKVVGEDGSTTYRVEQDGKVLGTFTLYKDGHYTFTPDENIAYGLPEGEKEEFDLKITVDDGQKQQNSTVSDTIHITITGTNEAPVINGGELTLEATEDTAITVGGKLDVSDDRVNEGNLSYSVAAGEGAASSNAGNMAAGQYGTLFINADGTYSYQLNNQMQAVQELGEDSEPLEETFTIFVKDQDGAEVAKTITVTINGTNDAPVLSLDRPVLTIKEGTDVPVTGNASATDVDKDDTLSYGLKDGTLSEETGEYAYETDYGTFYINKETGAYRFELNNTLDAVKNLRPTDVVDAKVTVVVDDGHGGVTEKELTVHIKGSDSVPEITDEGSLAIDVAEEPESTAEKTIAAEGWDSGPDGTHDDPLHYAAQGAQPVTIDGQVWQMVTGKYGTLYLDPKTGKYRYELTEDMNYLADGETVTESFGKITIADSTGNKITETITVTINGTNDAPELSVSQPAGDLSGIVTIKDVDTTDTHDVTFTGLYGSEEGAGAEGGGLLKVDLETLKDTPDGTKTLDVFNAAGEKIGELTLTYSKGGGAEDQLKYEFKPAPDYVNGLEVGKPEDISFGITVSDNNGGTVTTGDLQFTVTNENDAPVIMEATDPSAAGNNNSGKLKFSDADELDTQHSVTFTGLQDAGGNALVVESVEGLTEDKVVDVYKDGLQIGTLTLRYEDGELTYTLSTENFENNLPVGDSTIDFTITVSDKSGDTDTTDGNLQFTVTNDNDAPVIDEDLSQNPAAGNTGTLVFTDADVKDTHSVSFEGLSVDEDGTPLTVDLDSLPEEAITVYQDGQKVGELILTYSKGEDGTGTFTYAFDPDKNYLNSLPVGENKLDFGITVSDKNGREDTTGDLQFTVTNENDAPAITEEPSSGSNTGTLVFTDADVRDTHSVTFEGLYASASGKAGDSLKVDNVEGLTDGNTTRDVYNESGQKIGTLKLAYTEGDGAGTEHTLTYTFTPDTEYSNSLDRDSSVSLDFDLKIHDDTEDSNTVKGSVTIESTNQAPVIGEPEDDGSNTGTVAITDSDPDDSLTVSIKDGEGNIRTITAEAEVVDGVSYTYTDGTLRYEVLPERTDDLAPGEESTVEITVFVDDGHGKVEQTVSLPVTSTAPTEGGEGEGATEGETVIVPDDGDQASLKAYGQRQRLAAEEAGLLTAASFVAGITPEPAAPETFLQDTVPAQENGPEALVAEEVPLPQDETVLQEETADLPDADVPVSEMPLADDLLAEPLLFAGLESTEGMPEPVETLRPETADDTLLAEETDPATAGTPPAFGGEEAGDDGLLLPEGVEGLFGTDGDDYLRGGEGSDAIFGGAGNDIIVYDQQDYLVSGGSGIDFMVSDDTSLTLDGLLSNTSSDKPLVSGIEVLLKGEDALSLTSIKDLADRYGITLGVNEAGEETLQLDDRWTKQDDGSYDFNGGAEADGGLTLETSLTPVETGDPASEAVQQQVFTLEHSNG